MCRALKKCKSSVIINVCLSGARLLLLIKSTFFKNFCSLLHLNHVHKAPLVTLCSKIFKKTVDLPPNHTFCRF